MKHTIVALLLALGLVASAAIAMDFPAIKVAGITTLGEHTNRGGDSQVSFCNGKVDSGEFGIFDFDRPAIQNYINSSLAGFPLQYAIDDGRIAVYFSLVVSGNVNPNAQVGVMSVYTDDNWVEGAGASGPGVTTAYNWPGASTGTPACTATAPNDYVGQGYNWHRTDTNASGQQLQNIPGIYNSGTLGGWAQNVRTPVMLDDPVWCGYIFGKDSNDVTVSVPASTMLKTYGFGTSSSAMTCYTGPHEGDTNNDGRVDVVDLGALAKGYDSSWSPGRYSPAAERALGDLNWDHAIDVLDLGILATNYDWVGTAGAGVDYMPMLTVSVASFAPYAGQPYESDQPLPEPLTLSLLALSGLALLRRKCGSPG
jgi:hypothetical protein